MAQTSLIIGNKNWAVKEDSLLGYNVIQNKYLPIPIDTVRATTATRVNEQGLIEIVPRNLLTDSESTWTAVGVTVTSGIIDPIGNLNAYTISDIGSGNTTEYAYKSPSAFFVASGTTITYSIYMKGSGTISTYIERAVSGSYFFDTKVHTLSSEYQLFTHSYTATSDFGGVTIYVGNTTGTTANSVTIAFPQVNYGSTATEYFPTTNRLDIPRIDYSTGSAALLVEPQRTNVLTYSEQFDNAAWVKSSVGSGLNPVVTSNISTSPSGNNDADRIVFNTTLSTDISQIVQSIPLTVSSTGSVYLKAFASGDVGKIIAIRFNSAGYTLVTLTNTWQRFSATATALGSFDIALRPVIGTSTGSVSVLAWGAQLEAGAYPTSYIPTLASSVTRNADVISKTGISGLIGQTEGTMFVDINWQQKSGVFFINSISDGTTSNDIFMSFGNTSDNAIRFSLSSGGTLFVSADSSVLTSGRYKIAFAYANNDVVAYINGTQIFTDSSATIPATSEYKFLRANNTLGFSGFINSSQLYKTRLSNTELAQLTTI